MSDREHADRETVTERPARVSKAAWEAVPPALRAAALPLAGRLVLRGMGFDEAVTAAAEKVRHDALLRLDPGGAALRLLSSAWGFEGPDGEPRPPTLTAAWAFCLGESGKPGLDGVCAACGGGLRAASASALATHGGACAAALPGLERAVALAMSVVVEAGRG